MLQPVRAASVPRVSGLPVETASACRAAIAENWRGIAKKCPLNLYRLQVLTYRVVAFNRDEHAMDGYTTQRSLSAAQDRSEVAPSAGKAEWAAARGILRALAASACCILPLAPFMLRI